MGINTYKKVLKMKLIELIENYRNEKRIWTNPSFVQLMGISNTIQKSETLFRGVANNDTVCIGSANDWIHIDLNRQSGVSGIDFYVFLPHKEYLNDVGQIIALNERSMKKLLLNPIIQYWISKGFGYEVSTDPEEKKWLQTTL